MPPEHIRLSQTAREQLSTLKRRTGIGHWNVLCRWAFCRSLSEPSLPQDLRLPADSNLEMTWRVFSGAYGEELWALLRMRAFRDGFDLEEETLNRLFRIHLHRGISYLAGDPAMSDIGALLRSALPSTAA